MKLLSFLIIFPLLAPFLDLPAQQSEEDDHVLSGQTDNPSARAEYERWKRADPATGQIPAGIREAELQFAAGLPSRASIASAEQKASGTAAAGISGIFWNERGPANQGGRTRAVAVDAGDDRVFLAGGVSGGMWRTMNSGKTWDLVTDADQLHSVTCVMQDTRPGSRNVWYYGTGEYRGNSADLAGDGIFKSTDGGESWTQLASTVSNTPQTIDQVFDYVNRIVVDVSNLDQDEVYAACYGGIARSVDGGETWDVVLGGLENKAPYTDIDITRDGVLYATFSSNGRQAKGIWRSEDGVNWTDITPTGFPDTYGKVSLGIAPSNQDLVYFFAQTPFAGNNHYSLWAYEHGRGWEDRSTGLPFGIETYNSYCMAVRVKPDNQNMVYLGHIMCHRTTDGFRNPDNCIVRMNGGQHLDQHDYVFFPNDPNSMLAGHDGGVSITRNAGSGVPTWELLNNGYGTVQFYSVALDPVAGSNVLVGGTQDNGTWYLNSDESRADWRKLLPGDGGFCAVADSGKDFYVSSQNGAVYRMQLDESGQQLRSTQINPVGSSRYMFINPFVLDRSDSRVMYLPEEYTLWRNRKLTEIDFEGSAPQHWEALNTPLVTVNTGRISALATSLNNPSHRLYYGTELGRVFRMDNATDDDPESVEISGRYFPFGTINSIAVDPNDGDRVMVALSNYHVHSIFFSEDAGQTWDTVGGNLEETSTGFGSGPSVSWVAMLPVDGGYMYFAGTTVGLFSTTSLDGMNTVWVREGGETLGNVVVDMVQVREADGTVAVATHGRGVYTANVFDAFLEATLSVEPTTLNFDQVEVGSSVVDTVRVVNASSSLRNIRGQTGSLDAPFEIIGDQQAELYIRPGQSQDIPVRFSPTETGPVSQQLEIEHDATSPDQSVKIWIVGRGVPKSSTAVPEESVGMSVGLVAHPNPSRRNVEVRFQLDVPQTVSLSVLTTNGEKVALLKDRELMTAGVHRIIWDADTMPGGVYYIRFRGADGSASMPVVLER